MHSIKPLHPAPSIFIRRQFRCLTRQTWQLPGSQRLRCLPFRPSNLHSFATSQPVFHPLEATPKESKQRIPLLFFVIMGLLVGSASLQLLRQRDEFVAFTKETDEKLALLREVVKRIQNGENVDVEKVLGTGDPTREKEWEQVMEELRAEDNVFNPKRSRKEASESATKPIANDSV